MKYCRGVYIIGSHLGVMSLPTPVPASQRLETVLMISNGISTVSTARTASDLKNHLPRSEFKLLLHIKVGGQLWCQSVAELGHCNWYLPHCHCTPGLKDPAAPATLSFSPRWHEVCRWQRPQWPCGGLSGVVGFRPTPAPNSQLLTPEIGPALVPPGWSSCLLARAVQWVGGRSGLA